MSNLSTQELQKIADAGGELIGIVNEAIKWSDNYLMDTDRRHVSGELKKQRRLLSKVKSAVVQNPAVALFGASQVGKSYLVKNILKGKDNRLLIPDPRDPRNPKNFIQDMNPEGGGAESTSVVTRFVYRTNSNPFALPVEIKLLSPKDLIIILCDSYFSDFKKRKNAQVNKTEVEGIKEKLASYFSGDAQNYLTEDDVYDIEEYLDKFFEANFKATLDTYKDMLYWQTVADVINKIPPSKWRFVFATLWGDQQKLSDLFDKLISELNSVNFSSVIFADFEVVLRENGTILDVVRLEQLLNYSGDEVAVADKSGNRYKIHRNVLCAVTAEVVLNVSAESAAENPFINELDILDFPGARTRLLLDENDNIDDEDISEMLLRGKVSYLFNSYSLNYEINNLFVCTHNIQSNVRVLPELINNWIEYNIGSNRHERSITLQEFITPPLFIIFTWWNTQLLYDKDNDEKDDVNYKWNNRFNTRFNEEIAGTFSWPKEWTDTQPNFKNFYLLRDFKYSGDTFSGFEQRDTELAIQPGREKFYNKIRESFINSKLVRNFFPDTEAAWENTSTVNNDGSNIIIRHIKDISTNSMRTARYQQLNAGSKKKVESILANHYHTDEADGQIKRAGREGDEIRARLNSICGEDAYRFGSFIEHMTISEDEVFGPNHVNLRSIKIVHAASPKGNHLFRESSPRLSGDKTFEENLEILRQDYSRHSLEEVQIYFEKDLGVNLQDLFYGDLQNLKNASDFLAETAREDWFGSKLTIENFSYFISLGFETELLKRLLENLKISFLKLKITKIIAENIRFYVDTLRKVEEAEDMIAHITAGIINDFVTSMGWSFLSVAEKQKIINTNEANKLNLVIPGDREFFESPQKIQSVNSARGSVQQLVEDMIDLNENLNRNPINVEAIRNIPMIKNYRRWRELMKASFIANCDIPTYNIEANRKLGEILGKIKTQEFSSIN